MQTTESKLGGSGGIELFVQVHRPDGRPRAALAILHGHGEHSGRYQNVFAYFVPRGYAAYAFDLRGHGRSAGQRGFVRDWGEYRGDCQAFLEFLRQEDPGLPVFLYGHSLGGLIALDFALRRPNGLRGAIISGPILGPPNVPAILLQISKLLSSVAPTFSMNTQLDATTLSRDPEVVRAYVQDPLVHSKGTARFGTEMTRAVEWVHEHAGEWKLPLLIICGADDRLVPPADSLRFFERAGVSDKRRIAYPGGFHEPHNDIDRSVVFADIEHWLEEHL
jgi:alpha-beta hydrolase superfamily lysophospholipase